MKDLNLNILLEQLLNENRTKSAIDKWSNYTIGDTKVKDLLWWDAVVEMVKDPSSDPSGNGKYVNWLLNRIVDAYVSTTDKENFDGTGLFNWYLELVSTFHKYAERNLIKNKDIYSAEYTDVGHLDDVLFDISAKISKKEEEKRLKQNTDKIYEDDRWLVIVPKSYESSCKYGSGTKWCTTSKESTTYFNRYSTDGVLFYLLDKTNTEGKLYKIAFYYPFVKDNYQAELNRRMLTYNITNDVIVTKYLFSPNSVEVYNSEDEKISLHSVIPMLPKNLMDNIYTYGKLKAEIKTKNSESNGVEKIQYYAQYVELLDLLSEKLIETISSDSSFYQILVNSLDGEPMVQPTTHRKVFNKYYRDWYFEFIDENRFVVSSIYPGKSGEEMYFIEGTILPNGTKLFEYSFYKETIDGQSEPEKIGSSDGPKIGSFTHRHSITFDMKNAIQEYIRHSNLEMGDLVKDHQHIQRIANRMIAGTDIVRSLASFIRHTIGPNITSDIMKHKIPTSEGIVLWEPLNSSSTYKFIYPPKADSLTYKFVEYVKQNPGKTASDFYRDVLNMEKRPKGHHTMFFGSITDSGIVELRREGNKYKYYLGPNYNLWVNGKLRRG